MSGAYIVLVILKTYGEDILESLVDYLGGFLWFVYKKLYLQMNGDCNTRNDSALLKRTWRIVEWFLNIIRDTIFCALLCRIPSLSYI